MIDLAAVRADTPGASRGVFLDSAGSSLPPRPVLDEVIGHLRREAEVGGYVAAQERADDLEAGYRVFADLLGAEPDEIAFTDSATRSYLLALDAVPLGAGDRVLITEAEYGSNAIQLLHRARRVGAEVVAIPSDASGQVDVAALAGLLDERVKLVSLVHVPTNSGLVNPVAEVAAAARSAGALVLLDACQSVGQLPVRADELGVDLLSTTGRKWLRGPRGTGVLVVRRAARDRLRPTLVDSRGGEWVGPREVRLRSDARVFELWESDTAARLGLVAAARYALDLGLGAIAEAVRDRAGRLRAGLAELPGVRVRDIGEQQAGLVTFTVEGRSADDVRAALAGEGVTVTASRRGSTLLDMTRRGLDEVVRASPHYFIEPAQVDRAVAAVSRCGR
ncbi:aminotransferase class V-fold PLP-dependent enzyme [Saccharothrix algeriensis]|uniref:Probable hercynylcysteine sulfoxide lyase n=1 Tax=Saccharothrix algeriensis TaxID=173560 RepID=A0ABS2SEW2_9PSEU|nr:aminotransferase class V-fold PLP-dependent enzyme [Saccharothrix algeriensis]MBM7813596.1 selenocysteine lyase/cysteine desulfurase [Saccharothrix algeriensis]